MSHAVRRALRTFAQLVVSGALTALVSALANGLAPDTTAVILAAWQVVVAWAQNALEASGKIPTLLPSPPVRGAPAPLVAKTPAGVVLNPGR